VPRHIPPTGVVPGTHGQTPPGAKQTVPATHTQTYGVALTLRVSAGLALALLLRLRLRSFAWLGRSLRSLLPSRRCAPLPALPALSLRLGLTCSLRSLCSSWVRSLCSLTITASLHARPDFVPLRCASQQLRCARVWSLVGLLYVARCARSFRPPH